ncbi:hypothetical protein [Rhizobium sp. BR 314]|uniref:hypothetical protein n=1 Tax=Rhizobium sp. BR 314 TaxID=3040013 RepID=UPI0039BF94CD
MSPKAKIATPQKAYTRAAITPKGKTLDAPDEEHQNCHQDRESYDKAADSFKQSYHTLALAQLKVIKLPHRLHQGEWTPISICWCLMHPHVLLRVAAEEIWRSLMRCIFLQPAAPTFRVPNGNTR